MPIAPEGAPPHASLPPGSHHRFAVAVGKPVQCWVASALCEDGEVVTLFTLSENPATVVNLARDTVHNLICPGRCRDCA